VLTTVAQACRDEVRLRFSYLAHRAERTVRFVEPHRLVSLGRRWYLVAYDLTRHDWRSFRLDRLDDPERTNERFRPRDLPGGDPVAFVRAGIDAIPTPYTVEAIVHAPAEQVRAQVGQWATIEEDGDDRCRLRMTTVSLSWSAMALGMVGAEFELVDSPELTDLIREWSARFARATVA
jgi:predicted DNA-binding transcriptional regulator YafY